MKKTLIIVMVGIMLVSCQDKIMEHYKILEPIYMSYTDLRKPIVSVDSLKELQNPGKIYFWNNYIFVSEQGKGIHVIDNSDPSKPIFKSFIKIPANVDMSIKDGILYADSYIDFVAIDISDIMNVKEIKRIEKLFQYTLPPATENLMIDKIDETKGVVIDYKVKTVNKEFEQPLMYYPFYEYSNGLYSDKMSNSSVSSTQSQSPTSTSTGQSGSLARFTISSNALYAINSNYLIYVFDISDVKNPVKVNEVNYSWGLETLFPYGNKLFAGSQNGMYIYDISDPLHPISKSTYRHTTSCDPVVVEGNFAYITLRTGTWCNSTTNRLDVVNVSDASNPYLVKSFNMTNPHGLGINNNTLFVCDGDAGLKIYDASDKENITSHLLAQYPDNKATDVIPLENSLIMIGENGLYQYDYKNLSSIVLLSKIEIKK
jgi:hypothetical protein